MKPTNEFEQSLLVEERLKKEHFLDILNSPDELSDWVYTYLGIRLPSDTIDPDSNSNPVDAMWKIYEAIKFNKGEDVPGYIMLSAREAYKTLSSSILEVLILTHFQLSIAHMAAISSQSNKAISYIQSFLVKLKPYYDHHGWVKVGDSKSKIQFQTPEGNSPYITVIICTLTGANCISPDSLLELENGTTVRAAEVVPGMMVKTWDYMSRSDTFVKSKGISTVKKHARKITLSNNTEILVSDDHLLFTENGWVYADSVRIGNKMKSSGLVSKSTAIVMDHFNDRNLDSILLADLRYKLLTPFSRLGLGLTVDTGDWVVKSKLSSGFSYKNKWSKTRKGREQFKYVKSQLDVVVKKIEIVGLQDLVDIHIDNENPLLRSFYANGVFVHNSEHVPIMFLDEVDVVRDPQAYDEARLIPGMERGVYPITIKLSTRKFAFGMMQKELESAETTGEKIQRWNILDVTERCPPERHNPDPEGKKIDIYTRKKLPLQYLTTEEYEKVQESEKSEWEKSSVHPGCLKCELVSVCKSLLANKPEKAVSNKFTLYKPIKLLIKNFKKTPADMAEAQLMCWRPSTKGLVYPRFQSESGGNVVSIQKAYELITGDVPPSDISIGSFIELLHRMDCKFYAGIDWGYRHEAAIVVMAVTPSYSFIVDTYGVPGVEPHLFVEELLEYAKKYKIYKWFCDNAAPQNMKTLKRRLKEEGLPGIVPDFQKKVLDGIEAIRSKIVTSSGFRQLLVLDTPENAKIIQGFKTHHFILDMAGNPTTKPDDESFADVMDALRYIGQNIFSIKGGKPLSGNNPEPQQKIMDTINRDKNRESVVADVNSQLMKQEISKRTLEPQSTSDHLPPKGRKVFWNTE